MRILKIPGRSPQARQAQLKRVQSWMAGGGWQLESYIDLEHSAMFLRDPQAPPLGLFSPTRLLPGPGMINPLEWGRHLVAVPRRMGVLLGLAFAL
ncbi:MAG: hypothetical protein OEZ59_13970, partial [Deltaproteobacteria bacterium]|nr:hypothetical protein [Deltaproteobacteria bacterium]